MATNQKNAKNTSINPRNVETKTKTTEILNEAWKLGLFSFNLGENPQGNGYFWCFSLLNISPSSPPPKVALFPLLRLGFQLSAQSAPCFYVAVRRNLAAVKKHDFYPFSIQSLASAVSTHSPGSNSSWSLREFCSLFSILPWFVTYMKNK